MVHVNRGAHFVSSPGSKHGLLIPAVLPIGRNKAPFIPTFVRAAWDQAGEKWRLPAGEFEVRLSENHALMVVPGSSRKNPDCFLTCTILAPASVQFHHQTFQVISRLHDTPFREFPFRTPDHQGAFIAMVLRPGHQLVVRVSAGEHSKVCRFFWDGKCCWTPKYSPEQWQQRFRAVKLAA